MASITMAASFISGATVSRSSPVISRQRLVVSNAVKTVEGVNDAEKSSNNNSRRDLMFTAAAAAVCSAAGMSLAEEPRKGSVEAKKKYAPVCVTMPTARICHNIK